MHILLAQLHILMSLKDVKNVLKIYFSIHTHYTKTNSWLDHFITNAQT
jgi:hypothetical protein